MRVKFTALFLTLVLFITLFSVPTRAEIQFTLVKPENLSVTLRYDSDGIPYYELKMEIPDLIIEIDKNLQMDKEYYDVYCDGIEIMFDVKYGEYDWNEDPSASWNTSDYLVSFIERGGYWEFHPYDDIHSYDNISDSYTFRARFCAMYGEVDGLNDNKIFSDYSNTAKLSDNIKFERPSKKPILKPTPTLTPSPTATPTPTTSQTYHPSKRTDIFAQVDGIPGKSASLKYKNYIDIRSFRFDGYNNAETKKSVSKVYFNPIKITKTLDVASPKLLDHMQKGKHISTIIFIFDKSNSSGSPTLKITLRDVMISNYKISINDDGELIEEIGLSFQWLDYEYSQLAQDGSITNRYKAQLDYKKGGMLTASITDDSFDEPIDVELPKSKDYDIFAKIYGMPGESASYTYKNMTDVHSLSFEGQNGTKPGLNSASKVEFESLKLVKGLDRSSPSILDAMITGKHINDAIIYYQKVNVKGDPVLKLSFYDILVTSYKLSVDEEGTLVEEIGMRFIFSLDYEYNQLDQAGKTVQKNKVSIALTLN